MRRVEERTGKGHYNSVPEVHYHYHAGFIPHYFALVCNVPLCLAHDAL